MNSTQDNTETTVDSKNEIGTVNQANIDQKFYLYYYEQLTQTQKEAYLDLYQALQNQSAIYELKTPTSIKDFNIACSLMCRLTYPLQWRRLTKL